jgi:hypothetical protein
MTFNEFQSSVCSAHHCSAHFVSRVPAESGTSSRRSWTARRLVVERDSQRTQKDRRTRMGWGSKCSQKRVWTVSTPWASDSVVLASDWAGMGMFSKEWRTFRGRGWFESHLGHVFSLFRGFLASECGQIVL